MGRILHLEWDILSCQVDDHSWIMLSWLWRLLGDKFEKELYSECHPRILIIIVMFDLINCRFYSWQWFYLLLLAYIIFVSSIFDVTTIWRIFMLLA